MQQLSSHCTDRSSRHVHSPSLSSREASSLRKLGVTPAYRLRPSRYLSIDKLLKQRAAEAAHSYTTPRNQRQPQDCSLLAVWKQP